MLFESVSRQFKIKTLSSNCCEIVFLGVTSMSGSPRCSWELISEFLASFTHFFLHFLLKFWRSNNPKRKLWSNKKRTDLNNEVWMMLVCLTGASMNSIFSCFRSSKQTSVSSTHVASKTPDSARKIRSNTKVGFAEDSAIDLILSFSIFKYSSDFTSSAAITTDSGLDVWNIVTCRISAGFW